MQQQQQRFQISTQFVRKMNLLYLFKMKSVMQSHDP